MRRITFRCPESHVQALDAAEPNRSEIIRSLLAEAIGDGRIEGIPTDLRTLAQVEDIKRDGKLNRSRGTFRRRCAEFYREKWESGYVTGDEAEEMADSWRKEAAVYGEDYLAWVEAVVGWYRDRWDPAARPDWPDAATFYALADPSEVSVPDRMREVMADARESGIGRSEAVRRMSTYHPDEVVEQAARAVYADGGDTQCQPES